MAYSTWLDLAADCSEEEILYMANMWLENADELYEHRERLRKLDLRASLQRPPRQVKRKGQPVGAVGTNATKDTSHDSVGTEQGKERGEMRRRRSVHIAVVHESKGMGWGTGGRTPTAAELRNARLRAVHVGGVDVDGAGREARLAQPVTDGGAI